MDDFKDGVTAAVMCSPEDVFRDFRARCAGIMKALTTDVEKFYLRCDPEKENLCLYGFPNETWDVTLPAAELPFELPQPVLGINFPRDGITDRNWLVMIAVHSDAWLLSVAFYFGALLGFDKEARRRLFTMINVLPTVCQTVMGTAKKQPKPSSSGSESRRSSSNSSGDSSSKGKPAKQAQPKDEEDNDQEEAQEEEQTYLRGTCGETYANGEFWICCDICNKWFHGECVRITPAMVEYIKRCKCPTCIS